MKGVKFIVSLQVLLKEIFLRSFMVRDSYRLLFSHSNEMAIIFTFTGYRTILFDSFDEKWSG